MLSFRILHRGAVSLLREVQGAALLEFAITLPLLVVFVVGIFDFSGAFNQKQKIEQAAQEGAIIAGAQQMSDIASTTSDPESLHPVVIAVFNSLDNLVITINRGWVSASSSPAAVGTRVTVVYPYHWRFNSVIQLLFPGAGYAAITNLTESGTVHNQM